MKTRLIATMAALILSPLNAVFAATGMAPITGTTEDSVLTGQLKFQDTKDGLRVTGHLQNVSVGEHGFHIHEFGDCSNEGNAAGGHYNPDQKPHGHAVKDGPKTAHPGDMGNLIADNTGKAEVDLVLPGVTLNSGRLNVAGRAVIIHDKKDDFGQPTGNAGGRIGCGPIILTGQ